jgi:hypothetical protein
LQRYIAQVASWIVRSCARVAPKLLGVVHLAVRLLHEHPSLVLIQDESRDYFFPALVNLLNTLRTHPTYPVPAITEAPVPPLSEVFEMQGFEPFRWAASLRPSDVISGEKADVARIEIVRSFGTFLAKDEHGALIACVNGSYSLSGRFSAISSQSGAARGGMISLPKPMGATGKRNKNEAKSSTDDACSKCARRGHAADDCPFVGAVQLPTGLGSAGRHFLVVLDAPNVAMRHGKHGSSKRFSCQGIKIAIDYWTQRGHKVLAFLPDFYMNYDYVNGKKRTAALGMSDVPASKMPDDVGLLIKLVDAGFLVQTPPQDYDDSYSIEYARRKHGVIVTNDMYRDHIEKVGQSEGRREREDTFSWIRTHCISFTFVADEFVPNPDFRFPDDCLPLVEPPASAPVAASAPAVAPAPAAASQPAVARTSISVPTHAAVAEPQEIATSDGSQHSAEPSTASLLQQKQVMHARLIVLA